MTLEQIARSAEIALPTPGELAGIVEAIAARPDDWLPRVRLRGDRRWYERLALGSNYDVWIISWLPGQGTGLHDHGGSSGAFVVATGELEEHRPGAGTTLLPRGSVRAFGAEYAHDVANGSSAPAISIHAYSPPLTEMNHYELDGDALVPVATLPEWPGQRREPAAVPGSTPDSRGGLSIEHMLAASRARLRRLTPSEAHAATKSDAVLVDIRPAAQRAREGGIPGALVVERNVLEWRFDPASESRLPAATGYDQQVVVVCSEGYTSSLAAAALQDLGLWRATDVSGGFHAWRAAGYPTTDPER